MAYLPMPPGGGQFQATPINYPGVQGRFLDPQAPLASLYPSSPQASLASNLYQSIAAQNRPRAQQAVIMRTPEGQISPPTQAVGQAKRFDPGMARFAEALMAQGASTKPVSGHAEGIARALTGAIGGYWGHQQAQAKQEAQDRLAQALGLPEAAGMSPEAMTAIAEYRTATAKSAADAAKTGFSQEKDIRAEFRKLSEPFIEQRGAYNRILASAENPSAAGDIALLFNFMKVLDPGSVVRESEFATIRNAGNIPARIRGLYNRVLTGKGQLSAGQRADILSRSGQIYGAALAGQKGLEDEYRGLADLYGIDTTRAVPDFVRGLEPITPEESIAVSQGEPLIDPEGLDLPEDEDVGVEAGMTGAETEVMPPSFTDPDGNRYVLDPQAGGYVLQND